MFKGAFFCWAEKNINMFDRTVNAGIFVQMNVNQ